MQTSTSPDLFQTNEDCAYTGAMRIRQHLCATLLNMLNESGIPYCVLGNIVEGAIADSDLDIVIDPSAQSQLAAVLDATCDRAGAMLLQRMRYETASEYFVIAKQEGERVGYLNPDFTTEYRRDGRLWLHAEELLEGRERNSHGFWQPAPAVNFIYYLLKKVLKGQVTPEGWRFLIACYRQVPGACNAAMAAFWSELFAARVVNALLADDLAGFQSMLPGLSKELRRQRRRERFLRRSLHLWQEWLRIASRVLSPTGLLVSVSGTDPQCREQLAKRLLHDLAPAFRRTGLVSDGGRSAAEKAGCWITNRLALMRSTLVVVDSGNRLRHGAGIGIQLRSEAKLPAEENVQRAIARVLQVLSERLMWRNHEGGPLTPGAGASSATSPIWQPRN